MKKLTLVTLLPIALSIFMLLVGFTAPLLALFGEAGNFVLIGITSFWEFLNLGKTPFTTFFKLFICFSVRNSRFSRNVNIFKLAT